MTHYQAEYIWIDGLKPTAGLRSKTAIVPAGQEPPIWGYDGSSTNQADGRDSDRVLRPVFTCPDPIRGRDNKLVMCEVLYPDMTPHESNTRAACAAAAERYKSFDMLFGIEQEYTFFDGAKPLGWPDHGFPAPQGVYYCGAGADKVFGRSIVEQHMQALLDAGIKIAGVNAEVMPAQWEFQIGPVSAPTIGDQLWVARWLLYRIAEMHTHAGGHGVSVTFDPKPVEGDWNGAGAHTNFSTKHMRASYDACLDAIQALQAKHDLHIKHYGFGIERRLTGHHETARYDTFSAGVSNRGASVRIPWHVARDQQGYLEDRRPNANCDPYLVSRLIMETVCDGASGAGIRADAVAAMAASLR